MTTPDELSELFAAERAVRPSVEVAERALQRLTEGLVAPALVPVGTTAAQLGWVGVSKLILGGLVLGVTGAGGATVVFGEGSAPERPAPHVSTPEPRQLRPPVAASPTAAALPNEPIPSASVNGSPKAAQRRALSSPAAHPAASSASVPRETFDAELRLIDAAKTELDAGRPHLAEVWLGEHATRFSSGVFATDREALRVLAACAERREPRLARRFVAAHPTSPLGERLTHACEAPNAK